MSSLSTIPVQSGKRVRLTRDQRLLQLIEIAWQLAREEGADALTLPKLAEVANIAKPVVYGHFGTRNGLLITLYRDFDARQTAVIDAALEKRQPTLEGTASILARSYIECVLAQGREMPGVLAALAGSPELETVKRDYQAVFIEKCRKVLAPFAGDAGIGQASLWAMLGAADALSHSAARGEISIGQAEAELYETILAMVTRARDRG